jgi:PncC family amidohydrolase
MLDQDKKLTRMKNLVELLNNHNLTLASCESLTGGLFAKRLTDMVGAGSIFKGGLVVYSNEAKIKLAKISAAALEKYGAISKRCAEELAQNTQKILKTDLAISFTGNAGPTSQENKPVGLVLLD